jgi:hypothetical protein
MKRMRTTDLRADETDADNGFESCFQVRNGLSGWMDAGQIGGLMRFERTVASLSFELGNENGREWNELRKLNWLNTQSAWRRRANGHL